MLCLVIMRTIMSHEVASAAHATDVVAAFVVSEQCSKAMSEKVHPTSLNDGDEGNNYYTLIEKKKTKKKTIMSRDARIFPTILIFEEIIREVCLALDSTTGVTLIIEQFSNSCQK